MRRKTATEVKKAQILKSARTAIRLNYTLMADEEIARKLPELDAAIDRVLAAGKQYELDVASLFTRRGK